MYHYFISYAYGPEDGSGNRTGFGSSEIGLAKRIRSFKDIVEAKKIIEKNTKRNHIIILNFRRFEEE
jgi:hypothetical protein